MNIFSSTYLQTQLKVKIKQLLNVLPFFKSTAYTKFLIVGHPRTGTSLLHTYLNSHWNIVSLNEPLANATDSTMLFKKYSKVIKTVGFKYFYEYTRDVAKRNTFIELLKIDNIKIIKIERRNYLRTYVSLCIAEKTNEWSSTEIKQHSINDKKVTLTKEDCLLAFNQYKKNELNTDTIIREFNTPVFETEYETLVAEPNETMFAIQKFLNLSLQIPQSLLLRQNAEPLNVLIENYTDLKASFSGTEFETFFDE
jgi:hypothetical protein